MTSVDLTSRLTEHKLYNTLSQDNRQSSFIYFEEQFYGWVGQCLELTDSLRLAFRNLCAKLVAQQFKVLQLVAVKQFIHPQ